MTAAKETVAIAAVLSEPNGISSLEKNKSALKAPWKNSFYSTQDTFWQDFDLPADCEEIWLVFIQFDRQKVCPMNYLNRSL